MAMNVDTAVQYADEHAAASSQHYCARYVRLALSAGGADLSHHPVEAREYGPTLIRIGFKDYFYFDGNVGYPVDVDKTCRIVNQCYEYVPKKGDVVVIQPYSGGDPAGHIAIFSGEIWISDFKQRDMWAGDGYRKNRPPFMVYRP